MENMIPNVSMLSITVDGTNYTVAAGTGDTLTGQEIDMLGFDGVVIEWTLGAVTNLAVVTPVVKNSATSGSYGPGTIDNVWAPGSQTYTNGANASNRTIRVDISQPHRRYLRPQLTRGTANAAVLGLKVYRYRKHSTPNTETTGAGGVNLEAVISSPTPSAV